MARLGRAGIEMAVVLLPFVFNLLLGYIDYLSFSLADKQDCLMVLKSGRFLWDYPYVRWHGLFIHLAQVRLRAFREDTLHLYCIVRLGMPLFHDRQREAGPPQLIPEEVSLLHHLLRRQLYANHDDLGMV